jgi:hypothetical protein
MDRIGRGGRLRGRRSDEDRGKAQSDGCHESALERLCSLTT